MPLGGHRPTKKDLEITSTSRKGDRITAVLQPPAKGTGKLFVWDEEDTLAEVERTMPAGERRVNLRVKGLPQLLEDGADILVADSFDAEGMVSAASAAVS